MGLFTGSASAKKSKSSTDFEKDTIVKKKENSSAKTKTNKNQTENTNSKSNSSTSNAQSGSQNQTGSQDSTSAGSSDTTGTRNETQSSVTSLFGDEVQLDLEKLVSNLLPAAENQSAEIQELIKTINERSLNSGSFLDAQNGGILDAAEFKASRQLEGLQTRLAQQAGGSLANTQVLTATAEGGAVLFAELAKLESDLATQARNVETQELTNAVNLAGTQSDSLVSLLNVLKGATSESTGVAAGTTSSRQDTKQETNVDTVADIISKSLTESSTITESSTVADLFSSGSTEQKTALASLIDEIISGKETKNSQSGTIKVGYAGK